MTKTHLEIHKTCKFIRNSGIKKKNRSGKKNIRNTTRKLNIKELIAKKNRSGKKNKPKKVSRIEENEKMLVNERNSVDFLDIFYLETGLEHWGINDHHTYPETFRGYFM